MYEADAFLNLYVEMLLTCETEVVFYGTSANRFQVVFLRLCDEVCVLVLRAFALCKCFLLCFAHAFVNVFPTKTSK